MMLARSLKIGIVCPYSWDTPGGVQNHVRDLAEFLIAAGHHVSVLAPVNITSIFVLIKYILPSLDINIK